MSIRTVSTGAVISAVLFTLSVSVAAETAREKALKEGAEQLTSDDIAARLVGKTVTFVPPSGDKTFLVYYGEHNDISGQLVGGGWSDSGYYGITNADSVCLSWDGADEGRLRCMSVLVADGEVVKFNPDGSLNGRLVDFEDGKTF